MCHFIEHRVKLDTKLDTENCNPLQTFGGLSRAVEVDQIVYQLLLACGLNDVLRDTIGTSVHSGDDSDPVSGNCSRL